mgnify:CR=1 FL=1
MKKLIIGISGADGVCLAVRLLRHLQKLDDVETHLVMTASAERNLLIEGEITPDEVKKLAEIIEGTEIYKK